MKQKNRKLTLVANTAWSMFNFRRGLLSRLIDDGYQLIIIAPHDDYSDKLRAMGCVVVDLPIVPLAYKGRSTTTKPIEGTLRE